MSQSPLRILSITGLAVAAVCVASCGSNSPATMTHSPASPATASNQVAAGPTVGAWWDVDRKGLRVIYGVLGAAQQGPPTYDDGRFAGAAICMRKSIALLVTPSGAIDLADLPQGRPAAVSASGIANATVVFSPSCASSVAFRPGSSKALLMQGLLAVPKISNVTLPAGVSATAVSDAGAILVAIPGTEGSAAIQALANPSSTAQQVTVLSRFGGMAFLPGADSAVLADAAANTVLEASHVTGNLSVTRIAGEAEGIANPVAVSTSANGRWVAVANGKGSTVLRLDLTGQTAPQRAICHCSPTRLEPLAGNFAFRLTEPSSGTVWAFDSSEATPRIVFLPSEQASASAQGARP